MTDEHYSTGRRWSEISKAWIFESSWDDHEEIAWLKAKLAEAIAMVEQLKGELAVVHPMLNSILPDPERPGNVLTDTTPGMTLRQYYAGLFHAALIPTIDPNRTRGLAPILAAEAVEHADALIQELKKKSMTLILRKQIPARAKTLHARWCKKDWMVMSPQYRKILARYSYPGDRCFWCKKPFVDGETLALASFIEVGNKVLCQSCACELNPCG